MFEKLLADFLTGLLGSFVEKFDPERLRVSVWNGRVDLRDLTIRRDAFAHLGLPLVVVRGHIGSLHLEVPWHALGSKPIRLVIHDAFLLLESCAWSHEGHEERLHAVKMRAVQRMLAGLKMKLLAQREGLQGGEGETGPSGGGSWGSALYYSMMDNLQLLVRHIHVRFEDDTIIAKPGCPLAAGFFLHSLQAYTTNAAGKRCFSKDLGAFHKQVDIEGLALYWDTGDDALAGGYAKRMQKGNTTEEFAQVKHRTPPHPCHPCARSIRRSLTTFLLRCC